MRTDEELVEAMLAGDPAGFEALFQRHAPGVRRRVQKLTRDCAAADDLVQEVFLRLWLKAEQWERVVPLDRWLGKVATNLALNHLRAVRRRPTRPLEPAGDADDESLPAWMIDQVSVGPAEAVERGEERRLLHALLQTLPDSQREVVTLLLSQDMRPDDVAAALGIPRGTVKSRLHHARSNLARNWPE